MAKAKLWGLDKGKIIEPPRTNFKISFVEPNGKLSTSVTEGFKKVTKEVLTKV